MKRRKINSTAVALILFFQLTVACRTLGPSREEPYLDLGTFHRAVTTKSDEAQQWFDRGLYLAYGFNHEEAIRCFEQAVEADPDCAMAHWGVAYASGPNINNLAMDEAACKRAFQAASKAASLLDRATPVERELVQALSKRYVWPAPEDRNPLNVAYADAMRKVFAGHPSDPDVAALFAESLMILRPWNHWTPEGEPAPETPEIKKTIEAGFRARADHPGLCHFYIHLMEASPDPGIALAAADRLRAQRTDAGHLVHMPSHIDIQVGHYADAVVANEAAIRADRKYLERRGAMNFYTLYRVHNYHFLTYAAMFNGQSQLALESARELVRQIPKDLLARWPDFLESFVPTPYHVLVRFGRWDEILQEKRPLDAYPVTLALWHYARGIALAVLGRVDEAEKEQQEFLRTVERVPGTRVLFNNSSKAILGVAEAMLEGEIEYRKGRYEEAFAALRLSVERDDALNYDEPWGWMQPARHALGALLLEQGRVEEAAAVYRADLKRHPENGWALHGLAECCRLTGRPDEAKDLESRFQVAWKDADVPIKASCYCRLKESAVTRAR